ncbi:MAG: indole-3-glycerol phosphate synthase TrpC [Desulfosalsimonas sp.]
MKGDILEKIVSHKKEEIRAAGQGVRLAEMKTAAARTGDRRSLKLALQNPEQVNIIAEIKRASPSKGKIRADLDPAELAASYERGGAAAVSVLTDRDFFMGSLDDMASAKSATNLPVLRKDFIISEYQVYESAACGADAVLLIVRILSEKQLQEFLELCGELSMEALVEVHAPADLESAARCGAELIGINNRNLASFDTDISTAQKMAASVLPGQIAVAASGISSRSHIEENLEAGISRFLIGETLVRAADPEGFLKHLISG